MSAKLILVKQFIKPASWQAKKMLSIDFRHGNVIRTVSER